MRKWFVHDSDGREIYLTEERWEHIQIRHSELKNRYEFGKKGTRTQHRQNGLV